MTRRRRGTPAHLSASVAGGSVGDRAQLVEQAEDAVSMENQA